MESSSVVSSVFGQSKKQWEGGTTKGHREILEDDAYVHCPDCGFDCFTGLYTCPTDPIVYFQTL